MGADTLFLAQAVGLVYAWSLEDMLAEAPYLKSFMRRNALPSPEAVFIFEQYFWLFSKAIADGRTDARPSRMRPRRPTLEVDLAMAADM